MSWPGGNQQGGQWGPPGGYGGPPPQYGGGPYPPPERPPGGLSPIMIAVLAVVLAAVLIIAVAVVVVSFRSEPGRAAPAPSPSPSPSVVESADDPEPSEEPAESPVEKEALLQDGWQKVTATKYQLVYEVPGDDGWVVSKPGVLRGWEDDDTGEVTSMSGTSGYRDGYNCKHRSMAELGTRGITDSNDTETMSENLAVDWAMASYNTEAGDPVVNVRSVRAFKANGLKGHHAIVDVKVKVHETGCDPATARVHAIGVPYPDGGPGTRSLIIDTHTGVEGALSDKTVDTIVSTLRDVDHKVED